MTRKPRTNLIDRSDRYANSGRLQHFACFPCRKAFKRGFPHHDEEAPCPQCRQAMTNMGTDFKAPAHQELKQWRKVEALALAGINFFPQYPHGTPGERPATLADVPQFLRQVFPPSEGQRMLEGQPQIQISTPEGRLVQHGLFPNQTYSLLGRALESYIALEMLLAGEWRAISFVCRGNGNVPIPQPYAVPRQANMIYISAPPVFLTEQHRLRWPPN